MAGRGGGGAGGDIAGGVGGETAAAGQADRDGTAGGGDAGRERSVTAESEELEPSAGLAAFATSAGWRVRGESRSEVVPDEEVEAWEASGREDDESDDEEDVFYDASDSRGFEASDRRYSDDEHDADAPTAERGGA